MRRHRQDLQPMAEMNVTNLLDTAFILLMAFMIVAPSVKHGIELDLPQTEAGSMERAKAITIMIQKKATPEGRDRIHVDDRRLTIDQLREILERKKRLFPKMEVVIEADREVVWDTLAQVFTVIKSLGIEDVGLQLDPVSDEEK